MVQQRLPEPLAHVCVAGCTLEVHGGELGEGVLIQVFVIVFFFGKILLHGQVVDVYLLDDCPFALELLKTDTDMQRVTLQGVQNMLGILMINRLIAVKNLTDLKCINR